MHRRHFLYSASGLAVSVSLPPCVQAMQKQMKITGLETDLLKMPPREPNYDAIHQLGVDTGQVVLRITTDAGFTGWATSNFGMLAGGPRVVQTILEHEVKPVITGMDPAFPKKIRAALWSALEYHGVTGVVQFALAATDIALWDILGKAAGLPVYKMLGAYRDRMPVYSMCGWYYDNDADLSKYKRQIQTALEQGYRAMKIKTGRYGVDDDVRRIRLAKDLAGPQCRVMVDANQAFNKNEALRRGRIYQEIGVFWYEEPLPPHEMEGYAQLAQQLDVRIATGENLYTRHQFLDLMLRRGADVVQPDNRRAGGVTEWMEIAALSDSFGLELASHGGGAANLNMLCAIPNAIYMETSGPQKIINGEVLAPESPGMSTELPRSYIEKYKIG
ncbi:MAG: mandelate racemase/muconate lactonizing enzyme family protein [Bryobacteraceae bacterium]|nr:mandelate racemase/muconate lactonizing enzyme family protein [Bryobacteraceae bacterium]MDW8379877.1 mandelate racemase/muconate lactonizing enzyme family protein [Bryobacterales bacterium]